MRKLIICNLMLFVLAYPAFAGVTPQDAERFTHLLGINLAAGFGFDDLARRFGASPIIQTGDAEIADTRVCYRSADGKSVVEFGRGAVDYRFVVRDASSKDEHCPVSKAITADKLKVAELTPGMKRAAFEAQLGKPANATADHLVYQFEYVHTLTDQQIAALLEQARKNGYDSDKAEDMRNWDVVIFIHAVFKQERLSSLTVDRAETN